MNIRTVYKCGCYASGDNVPETCPMHGDRIRNLESVGSESISVNAVSECANCADLRRQLAEVMAAKDRTEDQVHALYLTIEFHKIEFHKDENNKLSEQLENAKLSEGYALQTVANLHKEVAELKEERDKWKAECHEMRDADVTKDYDEALEQLTEARAEIERLRDENKALVKAVHAACNQFEGFEVYKK